MNLTKAKEELEELIRINSYRISIKRAAEGCYDGLRGPYHCSFDADFVDRVVELFDLEAVALEKRHRDKIAECIG